MQKFNCCSGTIHTQNAEIKILLPGSSKTGSSPVLQGIERQYCHLYHRETLAYYFHLPSERIEITVVGRIEKLPEI
jgi:hypothetical protein